MNTTDGLLIDHFKGVSFGWNAEDDCTIINVNFEGNTIVNYMMLDICDCTNDE